MHYSPEQETELETACNDVLKELPDSWVMLARDIAPRLNYEEAREHIGHGACRRLTVIQRCIQNIFTIYPPRRKQLLSIDERVDLEINLHSFLINIHGLPDNLAWTYILERKIDIRQVHVELFNPKTQQHLPADIRDYLASAPMSNWHRDYAKNYRDALAHRVPPYIPPSTFTPIHEQEYRELHEREGQAFMDRNFELALELGAAKDAVGIICPAFLHSFLDKDAMKPMILHSQVIVDARTVMQIISRLTPHLPVAKG
jgi:hypothetical protein